MTARQFEMPLREEIEAELGVTVVDSGDSAVGVGQFTLEAVDGGHVTVTFDVPASSVRIIVERAGVRTADITREGAVLLSPDRRIGGCQVSFRTADTQGELITGTIPHCYVRETTLLA